LKKPIINFLKAHKDRIKALLKAYQEIIFWLPPAIGMVFLTRWLFPQLDPTSGIDGLGQLNAMIVNLVGGIIICFSAWLTKRTYDHVFAPEEIVEAHRYMIEASVSFEQKELLLYTRLVDIGVWALCFYFWYRVVFG